MIPMTLAQAATYTKGLVLGDPENNSIKFSAVATDTRCSMKQSLFIALKGDNFNGHEFIELAKSQGAVACMLDEDKESSLPVLKVDNTLSAMGQLAKSLKNQLLIPSIGITGSTGKTTVKEMVASILKNKGQVLATDGNFNNAIGVPLTLFRLTNDDQYAVIEMGASHPGDIDEIAQLATPDVVMITNVSAAHIQGLGSLQGVAKVKGEILDHLTENGTAVLEYDSQWLSDWKLQLSDSQRLQTFSMNNSKADYHATNIKQSDLGEASFTAVTPIGQINIMLSVPGLHNVDNALAAMAAAIAVGASLNDCKKGLLTMKAVKGRLQISGGIAGSRIIDDSYNANPASVKVAINLLKDMPGKRMLVLGDMAELGNEAELEHQQVGVLAKELGLDGLYATGKYSRSTVIAFGEGAEHFASKNDLAKALISKIKQQGTDDESGKWTLLIKGSRSAGMDVLVSELQEKGKKQQQKGTQTCF